jgi:nucleolar protein 58
MFTRDEVSKFVSDSHKYERKISKAICLVVYNQLVRARRLIPKACNALESLVKGEKNASEVVQSW